MTQEMSVLIIDDNADDRETYVRALKKMPGATYYYLETTDGKTGIAALKAKEYDCVLLDYSLPGMNGIDVLREIRMHDNFVPVILLTGQGNEAIAVEAIKKGAHDYLNKSAVNTERLHYTIQSAVNQRRLRRDIVEKDSRIRHQTEQVARHIAELESIKQHQEELIARLMESNSELERFAYVCSHDLQEPIRAINNYTQRLEIHLGKVLDDQGRHYMLYIKDGASHARKLIRDVLDFARLDQDSKSAESVSGEDILWNVLRDLGDRVNETAARVTHDQMPWLKVEPTHFRQLMQNLISNALKFNEDTPQIHIAVVRDGNFWQFSIRDNGIGIAPVYQEKIFTIFQRLNRRDDYPGSGIGLALCRKLVQKYGGNIWVTSDEGKGSTFYFTLPVTAANLSDVA